MARTTELSTLALLALLLTCAIADPESSSPVPYGPGIADSGTASPDQPPSDKPDSTPGAEARGDCAEPDRVNLAKSLAEQADVVLTGLVVAAGPGTVKCVATNATLETVKQRESAATAQGGPDLLVDYDAGPEDGSTVLLVSVQCVHKGALACRRNTFDDSRGVVDALGRCVIAVRVPRQAVNSEQRSQLLPCNVTPGFRYTMLLSSQPRASCDGAYGLAHARITDSVRPHLPGGASGFCAPYPNWPSQDVSPGGGGLAGALARTCPGSVAAHRTSSGGPPACKDDPCKSGGCPNSAAVVCVAKRCEGRFMAASLTTPLEACTPVLLSKATGLPVPSCDIASQQLVRQGRQAARRVGLATGAIAPDEAGITSRTERPRLVDPQNLFPSVFGTGENITADEGVVDDSEEERPKR